jgi:hypothetical protein
MPRIGVDRRAAFSELLGDRPTPVLGAFGRIDDARDLRIAINPVETICLRSA